jgi:hypothetical protein
MTTERDLPGQTLNILNNAVSLAVDRRASRISSRRTRSRGAIANGNRKAIDVLAHSIVPASGSTSTVGEVCASLGVALEEPQHPVGSSFSVKTAVSLAISAAVADTVEVALPRREVGGESSVVALAL